VILPEGHFPGELCDSVCETDGVFITNRHEEADGAGSPGEFSKKKLDKWLF